MNTKSFLILMVAVAGIALASAQPMKIPSGENSSSQGQQSSTQKQQTARSRYAVPVNTSPAVWYEIGKDTAFPTYTYPAKKQSSYTVFMVYRNSDTLVHGLWQLTDSLWQRVSACSRRNAAGQSIVQTKLGGVTLSCGDSLTFSVGKDSLHGNYIGQLKECLFYPATLRQVERMVKETYLALKYGVTLRSDYLSPEGVIVWDRQTHLRYSHAIAGMGSDTVHGLMRTSCVSSEDSTLSMQLLPPAEDSVAELLPGQYLLFGHNPSSTGFGTDVAIAGNGTDELLLELMERKWMVHATNTQGLRTTLSFCRDSLPAADTLYLLVDRSGKGDFDFSDCYGPLVVPQSGFLTMELAWDVDSSGTDVFTLARKALLSRSQSLGDEDPEEEAFNGIPAMPRTTARTESSCYPNPTSDLLHVRTDITTSVLAVVTDGQGSVLYRKQFPNGSFDLDVRGFAVGSYVLHLRTSAGVRKYSFIVER